MSSSIYQALGTPRSTRLLKLSAATSLTTLSAELIEVNLDDKPRYDAVSYTWGEDTGRTPISINGMPVPVRQNLLNFLIRLWRHGHNTPLWIDALSIAQHNVAEKGRQVGMIGDIFQQAGSVLVWLGEHADASETLFGPWKCPPGLCPIPPPKFQSHNSWWRLFNKTIDIPATDQALRFSTWLAFLRRPYWRRLWIVQETTLAASMVVHCGDSRTPWKKLISARTQPWMNFAWDGIELDKLCTDPEILSEQKPSEADVQELRDRLHDVIKLDSLRHQRSVKGIRFVVDLKHAAELAYGDGDTTRERASDIGHLNELFHNFRCVDKRDHVYALLSMEKTNEFRNKLEPDYHISAAELYVRACVTRLATWKNFYFAGLNPECIKREFIESMERVLLNDRESFEEAVALCNKELTSTGKTGRGFMDTILIVLKLSTRAAEFGIEGLDLPDKQRAKMDKTYEEYKRRRQRTNG